MKRLKPEAMAELIAEKRQTDIPQDRSKIRSIGSSLEDADDRRYLNRMGFWHRLIVRLFARHFVLFARAALATAADRHAISSSQAKTLARSFELRSRQGEK